MDGWPPWSETAFDGEGGGSFRRGIDGHHTELAGGGGRRSRLQPLLGGEGHGAPAREPVLRGVGMRNTLGGVTMPKRRSREPEFDLVEIPPVRRAVGDRGH